MPASGLLALLDDIATIADDVATMAAAAAKKGSAVADDVVTLTGAAAKKTSGVVTDDMAVTAEQTMGIRREREIPVVLAVGRGSFINKAVWLAPGALLLNAVAPWSIPPLLMAGGLFLAYEGVEKVLHRAKGHGEAEAPSEPMDPEAYERYRIQGAIRTDLILSAEIVTIALGQVATEPFLTQALVLYVVSVVMTVGVYGMVAGLVKLDDLGEILARRGGSGAALGRFILAAAPRLLHFIALVGTVAMLMVGGHILLEGIPPLEEAVHHALEGLPAAARGLAGAVADILVGGVAGLGVVGVLATGVPGRVWARVRPGKG